LNLWHHRTKPGRIRLNKVDAIVCNSFNFVKLPTITLKWGWAPPRPRKFEVFLEIDHTFQQNVSLRRILNIFSKKLLDLQNEINFFT
jgi:hypothetical protein